MAIPPERTTPDFMARFQPMDPTEALHRVKALVQTEPDFRAICSDSQVRPDTLQWVGQLAVLIDAMKLTKESVELGVAEGMLVSSQGSAGGSQIRAVLYKVLGHAELKAPTAAQGAFVAAGEQVDAYGAIAKILDSAQARLLIVDPYLDATLVTDFLAAARVGVVLQVLADEGAVKDTLVPAAERWIAQYGSDRPLAVRLAAKRTLHDRLIVVDNKEVWSLTQSIKDFAKRSHAAALKVDEETGALKVAAYCDAWDTATQVA